MLAPSPLASLIIGAGQPIGLHRVSLDLRDGSLGPVSAALAVPDATFMVANADRSLLYAVSESPGLVVALAVDPRTGTLTQINAQPTGGAHPCHLALDATGRTLIATNYTGGSVAAFPVHPDGSIGPRSSFFQLTGSGPNVERQERPHLHSATISPDNRFCYTCDLGLDEILTYRLGSTPGELLTPTVPAGLVPPGSGPRHAKITRDGRFLYVLNELIDSITAFARDLTTGALSPLQTISTVPPGHTGPPGGSELCLSPIDEQFIYAASRGSRTLGTFRRDPATGLLTTIGFTPTEGEHPRNFALSPDGRWLVCAHRYSHDLRVFAVDPSGGELTLTAHRATVTEPCCVYFAS